jgi:hypothetical protein
MSEVVSSFPHAAKQKSKQSASNNAKILFILFLPPKGCFCYYSTIVHKKQEFPLLLIAPQLAMNRLIDKNKNRRIYAGFII